MTNLSTSSNFEVLLYIVHLKFSLVGFERCVYVISKQLWVEYFHK